MNTLEDTLHDFIKASDESQGRLEDTLNAIHLALVERRAVA